MIDLVGGHRGDAELGRDRFDRSPRDIEVHVAIGGEVRTDVALIEPLRFITRQPGEERRDVVDGQAGLCGDRLEGPLVGPHERPQRGAVQRDMGGVGRDAHGGDLEVIADPGQQVEPFLVGDLFG